MNTYGKSPVFKSGLNVLLCMLYLSKMGQIRYQIEPLEVRFPLVFFDFNFDVLFESYALFTRVYQFMTKGNCPIFK